MNRLGAALALVAGIMGLAVALEPILLAHLFRTIPDQEPLLWVRAGACLATAILAVILLTGNSRPVSGLLMVTSVVSAMMDDSPIWIASMALALIGGILGLKSAADARRAGGITAAGTAAGTEEPAGESDNRLIWWLAFAPLIAALASAVGAEAFGIFLPIATFLLLNIGLAFCDLGLLEAAELDTSRLHAGTAFLVPWYLYRRQRATGGRGYFVTWLAALVLSLGVLAAFPYADSAYRSHQLRTSGLIQQAPPVHFVLRQQTRDAPASRAMMMQPAAPDQGEPLPEATRSGSGAFTPATRQSGSP